MDTWVISGLFFLSQIKSPWTFVNKSCADLYFKFLLGKYFEVEGLDHTVGVSLTL